MKARWLIVILAGSLWTASFAQAEVQTITATHTYAMGDRDSREEARALCYVSAKRKVLEEAGVFLESSTEITNFNLSKVKKRGHAE